MYYSLSPPYLSTLVHPLVGQTSRYNLRNANDLQTIDARTTLYSNSFLPSTMRDWNSLPSDIKNAETAVAFKSSLNKNSRFVLSTSFLEIDNYRYCILASERNVVP